MNKTLVLLTGLLCCLVAVQAAAFIDDDTNDTGSESEASQEETNEDYEEPAADVNCILFGDVGCNATCMTISLLYGTTGNGKCADDRSCNCTTELRQTSLPYFWREKFVQNATSRNLLTRILKNSTISERVLEICQRTPRTPTDTWFELIDEIKNLPELKKLVVKQIDAPVLQYVNDDDDSVDLSSLRKFVARVIQKALAEGTFPVKNIDYDSNLKKFLDQISTDQHTLVYIEDELHKIGNAALSKHLPSDLAAEPFDFETYAQDMLSFDVIPEYVAATVADQFIKYIDSNKNGVTKSPDTPSTKSSLQKPDETETEDDPDKYYTPNIDNFTSVENYSGKFSRRWLQKNGSVKVEKSVTGALRVDWEIGENKVTLIKKASGNIDQIWKFGDVTIKINRYVSGAINKYWNIGDDVFKYSKSASGNITANSVPNEVYKKYGREIKSWCRQNQRFFPFSDCFIYNLQ